MARPPKRGFIWWYIGVLAIQVAVLLGIFRVIPGLWEQQLRSIGWLPLLFVAAHLGLTFFEWFFHRYVLHMVIWDPLRRMYESHTRHHFLTRIELKQDKIRPGRRILNKYPITTEEQLEDAAFPEYALTAFWLLFTPVILLGQWLFPSLPVVFAGYGAIVWSLALYEILHHLEHQPYEWWKGRTEHSRFREIWKKIYGFHHMHHANIRCNEVISGFFGLPVADWAFGTYYQPQRLLLEDRLATADDFKITPPPRIVQAIDKWARKRSSKYLRVHDKAA